VASRRGGARCRGRGDMAGSGGVVTGGGGVFAGAADVLGPMHRGWGGAAWIGAARSWSPQRWRESSFGENGCAGGDPSQSWAHSRDERGDFSGELIRPRSEAHFKVLSRARMRAIFGARWAVPGWADPT
jgi:hypothetical protein